MGLYVCRGGFAYNVGIGVLVVSPIPLGIKRRKDNKMVLRARSKTLYQPIV